MIYELLKDRIINGSSSGQEAVIQSLSIAANGTYTAPSGVDGYSPVVVNVPERVPVVESIDITANGTYAPNEGVDGYNSVNVNVPERIPVVESKEITANGTYKPPQGVDGFNNVIVNVPSSGSSTKLKRLELNNGGQECLFNDYFLNLLDYGCEVICSTSYDYFSFEGLARAGEQMNSSKNQKITGENVDKFASFKINVDGCALGYGTANMFYNQEFITHLPPIVGNYSILKTEPPQCQSMFKGCNRLQEIPDNYIGLMFHDAQHNSWINDNLYPMLQLEEMFRDCHALRKIPITFSSTINKKKINFSYHTPQYKAFEKCYCLDEVIDFPIVDTRDINEPYTNNSFFDAFKDCRRLKRVTFKLDEQSHTEGNETITVYSPATAYWKNQTIDLSNYVGYGGYPSWYNPAFTADNLVEDDAKYQALKDTEDWWTAKIEYSRYNHNSAVETINTLPQIPSDYTDAGNTIKFKGASGSATDGGAINTLTQEEIAVATAKGWTVALV